MTIMRGHGRDVRELGYSVLEAGSGGAPAIPGMSGAEVAHRVSTTRPALPITVRHRPCGPGGLEGVSEGPDHRQTLHRHGVARKAAHGLGATGDGQGRAPQALLRGLWVPEPMRFFHVT